ncbi:MAG: hypothetical protein E7161_04325 [Firmicutes bacterium]|nr:hypothetical protein [Bacillota bacterium]
MKTLLEIRDFVNWVFHYKTIKNEYEEDLKRNSLELIRLNKKIKEKDKIIEDKEIAILLHSKTIEDLRLKKSDLQKLLDKVEKENSNLKAKIENYKREKRAIAKEMHSLNSELEKVKFQLEETTERLEYCKTHRRAPTKEEIIAYDYSRKEVLKRSKESKDNARNN